MPKPPLRLRFYQALPHLTEAQIRLLERWLDSHRARVWSWYTIGRPEVIE